MMKVPGRLLSSCLELKSRKKKNRPAAREKKFLSVHSKPGTTGKKKKSGERKDANGRGQFI